MEQQNRVRQSGRMAELRGTERETDSILKDYLTEVEDMTGYRSDGQDEDESKGGELEEDLIKAGIRETGLDSGSDDSNLGQDSDSQ